MYMQQRYYDPLAGRFMSIDPLVVDLNAGGNFDRYAYIENNPYRFVDPDGRGAIGWLVILMKNAQRAIKQLRCCGGWAAFAGLRTVKNRDEKPGRKSGRKTARKTGT